MKIDQWPVEKASRILERLDAYKISYGEGEYNSLIAPCTVELSTDSNIRLANDVNVIHAWIQECVKIYAEEINMQESRVRAGAEWNVDVAGLEVQRQSAMLGQLPVLGRIDAVTLDPFQQIAELQWKGGGEGFISCIDSVYREVLPLNEQQEAFGELGRSLAKNIRGIVGGSDVYVLNTGRRVWMQSESFLEKIAAEEGVRLISLPPEDVGKHLSVKNGKVYIETPEGVRPLDYLYLDRLSEALPLDLFHTITRISFEGRLLLDPPPSYFFNEKISQAIPFMSEYRQRFSDHIRRILIPTVLMEDGKPDLSDVIEVLEHPNKDLLTDLRTWEDLLDIPRSLRERLVFKCASANKAKNHGGRGVLRLWGSRAVAENILREILISVRTEREPWIVQPYIDATWQVPFVHPQHPTVVQSHAAHARFGIYCAFEQERSSILGGIATFSPFWKVAGKSARIERNGALSGSAFCDMRIIP